MYRTLSAVAAVVVTALMFVPAMAEGDSVTVSASAPNPSGLYQTRAVTVSLAGVDLGTAQGAATVLDRIDGAARMVCGERAGYTMNEARAKLFATCRARAVHYAVKELDAPQLTQIAAAR